MPAVLFCRRCGAWFTVSGVIPSECPLCVQETTWTTNAPVVDPAVPFALTALDRKLLRSFRIAV